MNVDFENMDELFRDNLNGMRVEPDDKVWANIENKLGTRNINPFSAGTVDGIEIQPSVGLWSRIARTLWIRNFFRFTANQLNIYYVGAATMAIVGMFWLFNTTEIEFAENNSGTKELLSENVSANTDVLISIPEIVENEILTAEETAEIKEDISVKVNSENNNISGSTVTSSVVSENSTMEGSESVSQNESKTPISELDEGNELNVTNVFVDNNSRNEGFDLLVENTSDESSMIGMTDNRIEIKSMSPGLVLSGIQSPSILNAEIGNREFTASFIPDTVGWNANNEPIVMEPTKWFLNASSGISYTQSRVEAVTSEYENYAAIRNSRESGGLSKFSSAGLSLSMQHKNLLVSSGVNLFRHGETYTSNANEVIQKYYYQRFETGYYQYDTVFITNIDSMLSGNPYQVAHVNREWVSRKDSQLISDYDTLTFGDVSSLNQYTYFEIPITAGVMIERKKFDYSVQGGLIGGLFLSANGRTLSCCDQKTNVSLKNNIPYNKFLLSAVLETGLTYKVTNNLGIFGSAYIRQGLTNMASGNPGFRQVHTVTGVRFGVRYLFDRKEVPRRFFSKLN